MCYLSFIFLLICCVLPSVYAYIVNDYGAAGNAAILHLDVGDRVYLKARDNRDQTLYGQEHQIYTTLTGELLYADNSASGLKSFIFSFAHSISLFFLCW